MTKSIIVEAIVQQLKGKVSQYLGAAKAAHAEATHEESKAEDKYDTRGLEASYLAAGQSRQMEETAEALQQFASMIVPKFSEKDPIDVGALVQVKTKEGASAYFIGPSAGGTEIDHAGTTILVITPQSPLGQQLVGRKQGDKLKIKIAGRQSDYHITSVT